MLEFWYEFASPYSYLAASRIEDVAGSAGVEVRWCPFLLGPIFAEQGWSDSPFNIYPAKGRYMWRDVERLAGDLGLPFRKPSVFPRNSVAASRVALLGVEEGWGSLFSKAVFHANFVEDQDIADAEVFRGLLDDAGLDGATVLERATSPDHRPRLRQQTEEASKRGIFGAPTFVVGEEVFWGNDRLEQAIKWARRTMNLAP